MNKFGLCPHTGKTFAEKFPASVYEAIPAPSNVTSELQFQRAMQLESGERKFLHYMINPSPSKIGGFYAEAEHVREGTFIVKEYPSEFRWFVIDPSQREELEYLDTQIDDLWEVLLKDKKAWWYKSAKKIHDQIELEREAIWEQEWERDYPTTLRGEISRVTNKSL